MATEIHERLRYRFGSYEIIPEFLEIRKDGIRVKLREQPFQILVALLERPGELVSREDLRRRLWPNDTFVDFDKGLNTAVNKLRQVLCDSAAQPIHIETVPRHGYRFMTPVERLALSQETMDEQAPQVAPATTATTKRRVSAFAAVAAVLIMLALVWSGYRPWLSSSGSEPLNPIPLTSYPGFEQSPSFSPDGSHVAFAWRRGASDFDIYVQTVGGAEPVKVVATSANEFGPAWSPDGSSIAYLRTVSETRIAVLLVPPTGGEPRRLTTISYPDSFELSYQSDLLAWTPDGSSLLLPDAGSSSQSAIWRLNVLTGRRDRITTPQARASHSLPRISGDGRRLAFQQLGGEYLYQVFVMPLSRDGMADGDSVLVAHGLNTSPLAWLGKNLFIRNRMNSRWSLDAWSPSGGIKPFEIPRLIGSGTRLDSGRITRDGKRLALALSRVDDDIWQMELSPDGEGLNPRPLIESTAQDMSVDYSPDGRRILFKSTRSGSHEAWLAAPDGSGLRQITQAGGLGDPRWSPDGTKIVYNRGEGGNEELFAAEVETGAIRRLTHHPARDTNARWARDGHWIYFNSNRTGRHEIWKLPSLGGDPVQVTKNGGENPFESPGGRHLYYGKQEGGESYVWRMPIAGGVEERLFPSLVNWASLAMGPRRMYFTRSLMKDSQAFGTTIYSYELASGRIRKVADVGTSVVTLSPSPDERRLIFGRRNYVGSDLVLVDGR